MGVAVERMPSAQLKAGVQRCEEEGDVRKPFFKGSPIALATSGQFLADQLTLFESRGGGQIIPTTYYPPPQIFGRCGVSDH